MTRNKNKKTVLIILLIIFCISLNINSLKAQAGKYKEQIAKASKNIEQKVISWRRNFHEHPELGNNEDRTAEIIAKHLKSLGLEVKTGVAKTGVVGILKGNKPGPVIALRADIDALPLVERTDVPFASKVKSTYNGLECGVMHACGHDAHTAILMGTAEILAGMKKDLKGTIVFIFQPAEEGAPFGEEGGAELMVKQGVLDNPKVDVIFALHMQASLETGEIAYKPGPFMAGADDFKITINGKGAHGSKPWASVDPIVVAAQIINSIQTIVSRNIDVTNNPAVVTIGSIHGGNRNNIIPEKVEMLGTVRAFTPADEELIFRRLHAIVENIALSANANATIEIPYSDHAPVTVNNENLTAMMLPTIENVAGKDKVILYPAKTAAEDFSYYANKVPGFYFFLGGLPVGKDPATAADHHTPDFFIDESSFILGVNALSNLVLDYMEMNKK